MRQIFEYHPAIGFRFVPNLTSRVIHQGGGYLVHTNATGFRCRHSFERARPPGKRRILLFGDSFTAGEGVSNGHRYGDHLENLLPDVEVCNFGLPATGPDQHYLIYREFARDMEHDLLLVAVFVENIRRVVSQYRYFHNEAGEMVLYAKPYFSLEDGRLQLRGVPPPKQPLEESQLPFKLRRHICKTSRFPRIKRAFSRWAEKPWFRASIVDSGWKERFQRLTHYQPIPEYKHSNHPAWQTMRAILVEWMSHHSAPVILMPIPLYQYVAELSDPAHYQARLREAADAAGAVFFDPLPGLQRHSPDVRRTFFFEGDHHLTRSGHEALARCLAPAVTAVLESTRE